VLAGLLDRVDAELRRHHRHVLLGAFGEAITEENFALGLTARGLAGCAELRDLYTWHDGTRTDGVVLDDIQVFPGFYFLSFADALANYDAFCPDPRWDAGWLPLFASGGGDFYVVDLAGADRGAIRHFRIGESVHPVEFASLVDMVATLVAAFESGVFFLDRGYLEVDDHAFADLAARFNPLVPWWTE
jgi:cell wall assembly regulator SMI1